MSASSLHIIRRVHAGEYSSAVRSNSNAAPNTRRVSEVRKTGSTPVRQTESEAGMLSRDELIASIDEANESVHYFQKSLHFRVHETSGQLVVEVADMRTGEVIRTVPPEEVLDSMGRIKSAIGSLIDKEG